MRLSVRKAVAGDNLRPSNRPPFRVQSMFEFKARANSSPAISYMVVWEQVPASCFVRRGRTGSKKQASEKKKPFYIYGLL